MATSGQVRRQQVFPAAVAAELEATARLAVQRHKAGDLATAEQLYGHVLLLHPRHPLCLHNLGTIRLQRNDLAGAIELLEAAARADRSRSLFHCTLGTARLQSGDAGAARECFRRAIELQKDNAPAWDGLGMALRKLERFGEAIEAHGKALRLDPGFRAAMRNLANTLVDVGDLAQAEQLHRQLRDLNPADPDVVIQHGILQLTRGDFTGWGDYGWSHWSAEWLKADPPIVVPLPQWDGENLSGRGLLLYGDQGIGDEIMFASLAPAASARAARTMLLVEPRLVPLFARSFPSMAVAAKPPPGQPPLLTPQSGCDVRCSFTRMAGRLGIGRDDFTGAAYLKADESAVRRWRSRLESLGGRLNVGISWRGGNTDSTRAMRSLALESFAPLFSIPGVRFVNVQYGNHALEIDAFNQTAPQPLVSFDDIDPLRDMDGLAAVLSALDLVISVDNSTVHLAGALGVPTWMLCPFNANWRWTQSGDSSYWYRSLRLFRQESARRATWNHVIERIGDALRCRAAEEAVPAPAPPPPGHTAPAAAALATQATAMLINDTAYWYHWGCTGTSLALHEGLRGAGHVVDSLPIALVNRLGPLPSTAQDLDDDALFNQFREAHGGILQRMQAVSEIVINGEGSLHDLGRTARCLLYLAWIARRRLGKRTSIVNHSCFPSTEPGGSAAADALYAKVYRAMDYVAVREAGSARELARLGVDAAQVFDCLPLFIEAHPAPAPEQRERRVVLCGGVTQDAAMIDVLAAVADEILQHGYAIDVLIGANAFIAADDLQLVPALHQRLKGRYRLVATTSEQQWLDCIAGASLLVSGRFHHSIAAAFLGTPFAVMASNTLKIDGLIERLELPRDAVWITPADAIGATARVRSLLENPGPARVPAARLAALREMSRLNFAKLLPPPKESRR